MIERRRTPARIEIADRGYGFINVLAGNKARGEFLKELETSRKVFQPFLTREMNEGASGKHFQTSGTCSEFKL